MSQGVLGLGVSIWEKEDVCVQVSVCAGVCVCMCVQVCVCGCGCRVCVCSEEHTLALIDERGTQTPNLL